MNNIFEFPENALPAEIVSPVITSLAGFLSAAIFSLVLPRVYEYFAYRDARELKSILDIKAGCEKSNSPYSPQLDELQRIYETRFTLSLSYWFGLRHSYPVFSLWASIAGIIGVILGSLIVVSLAIVFFLIYPLAVGLAAGIGLILIWQTFLWVERILNKKIQSPFFYMSRLHHPEEGDRLVNIRTFNESPAGRNFVYDYIGIPSKPGSLFSTTSNLKIYRLRQGVFGDIEYSHVVTRAMTLLEKEWFMHLNTVRRFGQRAHYIPFIIERPEYRYNTTEYMVINAVDMMRFKRVPDQAQV